MKEELEELVREMQTEESSRSPQSFSSPTSAVSLEETRILTEYISQKNLFNVVNRDETRQEATYTEAIF